MCTRKGGDEDILSIREGEMELKIGSGMVHRGDCGRGQHKEGWELWQERRFHGKRASPISPSVLHNSSSTASHGKWTLIHGKNTVSILQTYNQRELYLPFFGGFTYPKATKKIHIALWNLSPGKFWCVIWY